MDSFLFAAYYIIFLLLCVPPSVWDDYLVCVLSRLRYLLFNAIFFISFFSSVLSWKFELRLIVVGVPCSLCFSVFFSRCFCACALFISFVCISILISKMQRNKLNVGHGVSVKKSALSPNVTLYASRHISLCIFFFAFFFCCARLFS